MKNTILFLLILLASCKSPEKSTPKILIETNFGDIEVELYPKQAPKTAIAFLKFIDAGYFKNGAFYRVVMQEGLSASLNTGLIQGGIWNSKNKISVETIPHESTLQSKLSNTDGTISLARTTPGSASTEFFICIGDQLQYDYGNRGVADGLGYAAFGKVTKGMQNIRTIQQQRSNGEIFVERIVIKNIRRL